MNATTFCFVIVSILLSSLAQILLKSGMSAAAVQTAISGQNWIMLLREVVMSPAIVLGLVVFGVSMVFWLAVLSRLPVSAAYPFVALGIVLTVIAGIVFLKEPVDMLRLGGTALIIGGVVAIGLSF